MKKIIKILLTLIIVFNSFYIYIDNVFAATTATVNDSTGVYLRNGPGTNNTAITLLKYGTTITLVNTTKVSGTGCNGWYQVNYNGSNNNYICSELVSINSSASVNTSGYYTTNTWGSRINENYATVRKSPNGATIENIYLGTSIKVLEKSSTTSNCTAGWVKISYYNGKTGYICSRLISSYEEITKDDTEYAKTLKDLGFPDSYIPFLSYLHSKYPNWKFVVDKTNKSFDTAVKNENNKNYIQTTNSAYRTNSTVRENPYWYTASSSVVGFMLDPRNYLTEKNIFAFETLSYDKDNQTEDVVKSVLGSSYLAEDAYISYLMNAAKKYNISPVHLATRIKQEGGTIESYVGISGTATSIGELKYGTSSLDGFYNYYNIGSQQDAITNSAVTRGLAVAGCIVECSFYGTNYGAPWKTREDAIMWGAKYIADGYINNGQDTMYYQKFNVAAETYFSSYTHQYMTNIIAPLSESLSTYESYQSLNLLDKAFVFKIPVYNNMPTAFTSHPIIGDDNNDLSELQIDNVTLEGFDKDVIEYTSYVSGNKEKVNISARAESATSTMIGTGDIILTNEKTTTTIVVTSEAGTTKVYTINIIKVDTTNQTINDIIDNLDVKINDEYNYLTGIEVNVNANSLILDIKKISPDASISIKDINTKDKTTEPLATGDILSITINNETKTYTIAIKGDINGDGKVSTIDLLRIQKHILNYITLEGVYSYTADTNYDGKVSAIDMLRIQKHILNYIKLK